MEFAVNFKSASFSELSNDSASSTEAQNDGEMVPAFYRQGRHWVGNRLLEVKTTDQACLGVCKRTLYKCHHFWFPFRSFLFEGPSREPRGYITKKWENVNWPQSRAGGHLVWKKVHTLFSQKKVLVFTGFDLVTIDDRKCQSTGVTANMANIIVRIRKEWTNEPASFRLKSGKIWG